MFVIARRAFIVLPFALAACGGGDSGGTAPSTVASITVTSPAGSASVGNTIQFTAVAKNASGSPVTGITFTWTSSDTTLATVSSIGLVTAVAPGPVTIAAAAQGKSGNAGFTVLDVPVLSVDVTPATPSIGVTGTVILTATPRDAATRPLARPVTWTVSDAAKVSLSATTGNRITATGLGLGTGVTVTATAGGRSGVATLNVVAGSSPTITSITPNPLVPGGTATINGVNFDPTPANNVVRVDDLPATVTAASATQLTITVPAAGFTCSAVRDVPVQVVSATLTGSRLAPLDPARIVDLAAGQSIFFDASAAAGSCVKLPAKAGANYLLSITNINEEYFASGGFVVNGVSTAATLGARVTPLPSFDMSFAPAVVRTTGTPMLAEKDGIDWQANAAAHMRLLERDRAIVAKRGGPGAAHAALAQRRRLNAAVAFNPHVGDTMNVRIADLNNDVDCTKGFNQRARVVYASAKTVIFDDMSNPLFGQVDAQMQQMGQEFDNVTLPVETTNFGNPLAYDATLGNKGHVLIFFTSKVNTFIGGNLLGFVYSCDFYPYDVSGNPATQDTVSNEAPIFYAMVPTVGGTGVHSVAGWQATLRPVLAHETKHIVSYAEKFQRNAMAFEDAWLEEATAQTASEIYGRTYTGATWKGNNQYATTVRCEVVLTACTGDHPAVMTHHFGWLMDYLSNFALDGPSMNQAEAEYGGSWNFVRYTVDQYSPVEADMLQAITQTTTVFGTANLALRAGVPWSTLVTRWNAAIALAQYGTTPADPLLTIPSWDMKGIYNGLNADWSSAFTTPYPLLVNSVPFTGFQWSTTVQGGGAALTRVNGAQASPLLLSFLAPNGTIPLAGNPLRLGIFRIQ